MRILLQLVQSFQGVAFFLAELDEGNSAAGSKKNRSGRGRRLPHTPLPDAAAPSPLHASSAKKVREAKNTFQGRIGSGRLPHTYCLGAHISFYVEKEAKCTYVYLIEILHSSEKQCAAEVGESSSRCFSFPSRHHGVAGPPLFSLYSTGIIIIITSLFLRPPPHHKPVSLDFFVSCSVVVPLYKAIFLPWLQTREVREVKGKEKNSSCMSVSSCERAFAFIS